jgi:uncharacterized protein GlcG (DUF336 family)
VTKHRSIPCLPLLAACAVVAGIASPAAADGLLTTHRISASLANEAVGTAVATCAGQGYTVTSVLLDMDGVRQAVLRGDAAGIHTLDGANDKAYTSVTYKTDTGVLVERAKTIPPSALMAKLPHLVLAQGAIVIKIGDEQIGAIGVSGAPGGEKDEACARAGIAQIQDRLK